MEGIERPQTTELAEKVFSIERQLSEVLPMQEIIDIFGKETFLIGGFVRDLTLGKNLVNSDFDLMTRMPYEQVIANLHRRGFSENDRREFKEDKYSLNSGENIIDLMIKGRKVQVGLIGQHSTDTLISLGDITMNCCTFDLGNKKLLNLEMLDDIINKKLKFCSPEEARKDPWKIISALKQISRIPDLSVPEETWEVIKSSIASVIDYFVNNPSELPELQRICDNLNSREVLNLFDSYDTKGIFDGINFIKPTLETSGKYTSIPIESLDEDIRQKIIDLAKKSYGRRLDLNKLFNDKINSVVYEVNNQNEVVSCCLISGERIYAIASADTDSIVNLVRDLCQNNYTVWATISLSSRHIIDLAQKAGLKLINSPSMIEKIFNE